MNEREREREREREEERKKERSWSIFRGYLRRFVRTYLSSPGDDSSSGPNTTVFGSRECLIPRCCMWLLSCRARGGHIPKPRETRSDTDAHEHANKQNYSSIDRGIPHRYPIDLFPPLRPLSPHASLLVLFPSFLPLSLSLFLPFLSGHRDNLTLDFFQLRVRLTTRLDLLPSHNQFTTSFLPFPLRGEDSPLSRLF